MHVPINIRYTRLIFSNIFVENRAVYDMRRKYIVEFDRPQMVVWRMRISGWIPRAKNTHSEYVTHCFSTATTVARMHLSVMRTLPVLLFAQYSYNQKQCWLEFYTDVCSPCVRIRVGTVSAVAQNSSIGPFRSGESRPD